MASWNNNPRMHVAAGSLNSENPHINCSVAYLNIVKQTTHLHAFSCTVAPCGWWWWWRHWDGSLSEFQLGGWFQLPNNNSSWCCFQHAPQPLSVFITSSVHCLVSPTIPHPWTWKDEPYHTKWERERVFNPTIPNERERESI
jgi:hypothetical protein